jgi:galactonate dehydratase
MNRRDFLRASTAAASSALVPTAIARAAAGTPDRRAAAKITEVRIFIVSVGGRHPVLAQVFTDQGVSGVGEAALAYGTGATAAAGMIKDLANDIVLGKDAFAIEALWSDMYDHTFWAKGGGSIVFAGISAIEMALWDIKGKLLGVPVYELLGGKMRDTARVYANGWNFRSQSPDDDARAAEKVVRDGYTALKLYPLATAELDEHGHIRHVSRRSIDRAAENLGVARVKAVRNAVGPNVEVMLDVSAELTTDAILRFGQRVQEFDIAWFEEPVDPADVEALKKVSDRLDMPIAVGERLYTRYGFRRVMELHAADILQPDVGNTGGIMETKKIAAMAEAYSMRISPHNCASPVCTAASLHVDASIANFLIQEIYPYRIPEHFALVDHAPELDIRNGLVPIPTRPGLGVELVEARVKSFEWARCTP